MKTLIESIDIDDLFVEFDFLAESSIDLDDLDTALIQQGALHYKYGKLAAVALKVKTLAEIQYDSAKRNLTDTLARMHEQLREERLASGEKTTDKLLENLAKQTPEYEKALKALTKVRKTLAEVAYEASILALGEKVFAKRAEMLITLGIKQKSMINSENAEVRANTGQKLSTRQETSKRKVKDMSRDQITESAKQVILRTRKPF